MALTKAERNDLMERLLRGGLHGGVKAEDVKLRERDDLLTARLVPAYTIDHEPTGSEFFLTGPLSGGWSGRMRAGTDPETPWKAENWAQMLAFAGKWAGEVAEWARTPDMWALDAAPLPEAVDNSPFTQAERDEIAMRLDEIYDHLSELWDLRDHQAAAIGQTIEELKEASERVGRKDWKLMFYGAFVSVGLAQVVPSGVVEAVFRLAVQGLGHFFGAGGPPMITA
jgi:hypothetical protein